VIVDSTNALKRSDQVDEYQEMLTSLKTRLLDTDSLGVLHCITEESSPPLRATTLIQTDSARSPTVYETSSMKSPTIRI
jgi:hypothetical protein